MRGNINAFAERTVRHHDPIFRITKYETVLNRLNCIAQVITGALDISDVGRDHDNPAFSRPAFGHPENRTVSMQLLERR